MRYTTVVALALATLASAQSPDEIPSCALPCLDDAVKQTTSCATDDFSCICKNFDSVQGAATGCILKACGQDVALNQVLPATQDVCKKAEAGGGTSSSAPASSDPSQQPTGTVPPAGTVPVATGQQTTQIPTSSASTTAPTTPSVVTAGAAGFAPMAGLAMLALGALAL